MKKKYGLFIILPFLFLLTGCANMFLGGSKMWRQGVPEGAMAKYTVPVCNTNDGKQIDGPKNALYVLTLHEGQLVLLELDQKGEGVIISNHWVDEKGNDNFVTSVAGSHGWHYIIPRDRTLSGTRVVYPAGSYQIINRADGSTDIIGTPFARCPMIPKTE